MMKQNFPYVTEKTKFTIAGLEYLSKKCMHSKTNLNGSHWNEYRYCKKSRCAKFCTFALAVIHVRASLAWEKISCTIKVCIRIGWKLTDMNYELLKGTTFKSDPSMHHPVQIFTNTLNCLIVTEYSWNIHVFNINEF